VALLDRALVLDPNQSAAWYLGGFQRVSLGEHDNAIRHFTHAMRLSPLDPEMVRMQTGMALAHLLTGRLDTALAWAERASGDMPDFLLAVGVIAACHALTGRTDEAQRAMSHLRGLDPTLRVGNLPDWILLHRPQDLATFADGLRGAGLPD
jgi:tetratricopeptide (TPR) repeat protein